MLSFFVDPNDTITVRFFVANDKSDPKTIYCSVDRSELAELYPTDSGFIEEHSAIFKRPGFADSVKISDSLFSYESGSLKTNASSLRINKIMTLLKSWTLDKEISVEKVEKLQPSIAKVLGDELDRLLP